VPRFAIAPLGLTTEGSTKFKLKGWKCYPKKLQCLKSRMQWGRGVHGPAVFLKRGIASNLAQRSTAQHSAELCCVLPTIQACSVPNPIYRCLSRAFPSLPPLPSFGGSCGEARERVRVIRRVSVLPSQKRTLPLFSLAFFYQSDRLGCLTLNWITL